MFHLIVYSDKNTTVLVKLSSIPSAPERLSNARRFFFEGYPKIKKDFGLVPVLESHFIGKKMAPEEHA